MKTSGRFIRSTFVVLPILLWLPVCTTGSTVEPPALYQASDQINGGMTLPLVHTMIVENPIGYVIISGTGPDTAMTWFLNRTAQAGSMTDARNSLPNLLVSLRISSDTLFVRPTASAVVNGIAYSCLLSLSIPTTMDCKVGPVHLDVNVNDLNGHLSADAGGSVDLLRFTGTSEITTTGGSITVETALGDSDSCICITQSGNILLQIPQTTSATLTGQTGSGAATYSGLIFASFQSSAHSITGILGNGTAVIRMQSANGNLVVRGF